MKNPLKAKLKQGKTLLGAFVSLGHPDVSEWLSQLGFDYILLDMEHSPIDINILQQMMQAIKGSDCVPIVRPPTNEPIVIKRILDAGAFGIVIPMVNTRIEAENAVKACRYPPEGIRGYGPRRAGIFDPEYFRTANKEIFVMVQIETQKGVANADEILSVEGIDACEIGHNDLALDMGFSIPPPWNNLRFLEAFDRVAKAATKHGVAYGFNYNGDFKKCVAAGCRIIEVGTVDGFLLQGAQASLKKVHEALGE